MSIALNHITLSYGSRTLLEDVTAAFAQGSLTALIGRNGTGKSTLLRAIAGLGTTVSGDVALCGRPLASLTPHELSTTVGFVTTDKVRIANLACEDVVAPPSDMRSMVLRAKADIPTRRSERSTTARSASCMRPIQLV